jgi:hypothetical protein
MAAVPRTSLWRMASLSSRWPIQENPEPPA